MHDWLGVRGYRGDDGDAALRKRVRSAGAGPTDAPAPARPPGDNPGGADLGPGHEERGGYVDVELHRY